MKLGRSAVFAVLVAAVVGGAAGPVAATESVASPATIGPLPSRVRAQPDGATVSVSYRCVNTADVVHYVSLRLSQQSGAAVVAGCRNDSGGVVAADCTGQQVQRSYRLQPTLWAPEPVDLTRGTGDLVVELMSKGSPAIGGWLTTTGPTVTAARSVRVVVR